jgi:hypothetical protein
MTRVSCRRASDETAIHANFTEGKRASHLPDEVLPRHQLQEAAMANAVNTRLPLAERREHLVVTAMHHLVSFDLQDPTVFIRATN